MAMASYLLEELRGRSLGDPGSCKGLEVTRFLRDRVGGWIDLA